MGNKGTGMEVNIHKSSILFNGLEEERERLFMWILPYNFVPFNNGEKYLGFHLKPSNFRFGHGLWLYEK